VSRPELRSAPASPRHRRATAAPPPLRWSPGPRHLSVSSHGGPFPRGPQNRPDQLVIIGEMELVMIAGGGALLIGRRVANGNAGVTDRRFLRLRNA